MPVLHKSGTVSPLRNGTTGEYPYRGTIVSENSIPTHLKFNAFIQKPVRSAILEFLRSTHKSFLQDLSQNSSVDYTELSAVNPFPDTGTSFLGELLTFSLPLPEKMQQALTDRVALEHKKLREAGTPLKKKKFIIDISFEYMPLLLCFWDNKVSPYLNAYIKAAYRLDLALSAKIDKGVLIIANYLPDMSGSKPKNIVEDSGIWEESTGVLLFKGHALL